MRSVVVPVGAQAPPFALRDAAGRLVGHDPARPRAAAILFYRGHW